MTLLAEIGQAVRGAIGGDVFPLATLHIVSDTLDDDGQAVRIATDHTTTGFISAWTAKERLALGYGVEVGKVVLVQSPTLPRPKEGDEVTAQRPITGDVERYRVTDASADPADATWAVAGVRI